MPKHPHKPVFSCLFWKRVLLWKPPRSWMRREERSTDDALIFRTVETVLICSQSRASARTRARVCEFLLTPVIRVASKRSYLLVVLPRHSISLAGLRLPVSVWVQPELQRHLENGSKWSWKGSEFSNKCVVFLSFAKITKCSAARP